MDTGILPIRPSILDDVGVEDIPDLLLDRLPDQMRNEFMMSDVGASGDGTDWMLTAGLGL